MEGNSWASGLLSFFSGSEGTGLPGLHFWSAASAGVGEGGRIGRDGLRLD